MLVNNFNVEGLNAAQVAASRVLNGTNVLDQKKANPLIDALKSLVKEPMVILLLVTSCIYFISGKTGDGIFLGSAIILVAGISLYQDSRSRNALEALREFTQPQCKVIRNGEVLEIKSADLVVGDSLMIEEGTSITADGTIIHSNDFSVNESILTGESLAVYKDSATADHFVFYGTTVVSGLAVAKVTAIGNQTRLGKIGKSLEDIDEEKTPLELQINDFVRKMVIVGAIVFLGVWSINFLRSADLVASLIKALTLAMSILPEEIPVAFTTFMALGAWRMMKMGIVVKQMKTVETLGAASVICTDKTGTLTENRMSLAKVFTLQDDQIADVTTRIPTGHVTQLIRTAMWASEPIPFDPMEIALHEAYSKTTGRDERTDYRMIHEYPLNGKPPMMTHLFENEMKQRIIAAKGAVESLIMISDLNNTQKAQVIAANKQLAVDGYRVLAVGSAHFEGNDFPAAQQDLHFSFQGLVAFYDPPKKNISEVLQSFDKAGIRVKIITGDNAGTTISIARQIAFKGLNKCISGDALMQLSDSELQEKVTTTDIYTRMFPEAKLRIINALKANKEIVAMTGDGVNDGPALKAAHIGIAMGKKGTEIAKQAASLVLLEDDLSKMVEAVAMGRRIYANLKKAIQYIISIHIPIILIVFVPLALNWVYPNIFSPVHIIFLELIMGPTCSIIYENEPMEEDMMLQKPRPFSTTFFNWKELMTSVIQGLVISAGTMITYQYAIRQGFDEQLTCTMVFTCLISANIILTLVNRSFYYSILTTIRYKNNLVLLIIMITLGISAALIYVGSLARFFGFESLSVPDLALSVAIGSVTAAWIELPKWRIRAKSESRRSVV